MRESISCKIKCTLISPLFIFSVSLMILNDHMLKGAGILPQNITGKLSDFAFLFFVPVVVAFLFRVKTIKGLSISYLSVALLFSAINISKLFSQGVEALFNVPLIPLALWPDPTDLIALTILPCSIVFLLSKKPHMYAQPVRYLHFGVVLVCLTTCVATSPARRPTHEPIYMSWKEFRESTQVMPPQDIRKRGKIYIKDGYLHINEPNKRIHIFDNSNPENPVPKCFLNIPGNTDIAIKGSYLYADSFVDLLVFALTLHPKDIILANRVADVFPYDSNQNLPLTEVGDITNGSYFHPSRVDQKKGVVIGWRRIKGR